METRIDFNLDDIVFENRNKDYGAYVLRKEYGANLTKATLLGAGLFLTIFTSSFIGLKYHKTADDTDDTGIYRIVDTIEPPSIIPDVPEPPKPSGGIKVATVVIPELVEPVNDETPEKNEVLSESNLENKVIGSVAIEGEGLDETFHLPPAPETNIAFVAPEPPAPPKKKVEEVFMVSEIMPEFKGGFPELYKWLGKNLRYPSAASRNGIEGRVIASFIIEKDGSISDVKVLKGIGFGCDEETSRVIQAMPSWSPGKQNGSPVRVKYTLPLTFKIE
ncbi:energy transducer TonB [Jiulongibacter sp. NS-SX5]|uniref:energy transducer TonB n=1 Tax=Jiulongibacter sp. NS-SX5 TaxID=3463854 RepID=UPI00405A4AF4